MRGSKGESAHVFVVAADHLAVGDLQDEQAGLFPLFLSFLPDSDFLFVSFPVLLSLPLCCFPRLSTSPSRSNNVAYDNKLARFTRKSNWRHLFETLKRTN
jgi:hypothetical protein